MYFLGTIKKRFFSKGTEMKLMIKTAALLLALSATSSVMAQQVTQAQKDGTANLVTECVIKKAPANWEAVSVSFDRTNPSKPLLYNMARVKGSDKPVDIDVSGCDINKQAQNLLMFQAVIPADQANWKVLVLNTNPAGQYLVFTDIALSKSQEKK